MSCRFSCSSRPNTTQHPRYVMLMYSVSCTTRFGSFCFDTYPFPTADLRPVPSLSSSSCDYTHSGLSFESCYPRVSSVILLSAPSRRRWTSPSPQRRIGGTMSITGAATRRLGVSSQDPHVPSRSSSARRHSTEEGRQYRGQG